MHLWIFTEINQYSKNKILHVLWTRLVTTKILIMYVACSWLSMYMYCTVGIFF